MTLNYVNQGQPMTAQPMSVPGMIIPEQAQYNMPAMPAQQGCYAMPYAPVYGNQPSQPCQFSAVKIDIIDPKIDAGQAPIYPGRTQVVNPMPQQYMMPPPMPQQSFPPVSTAYPIGIPNVPAPQYIAPPQSVGLQPPIPQPMVQQLPPPIPQPMPVPPQVVGQYPVSQMPTVVPVPVQNTQMNQQIQTPQQLQPQQQVPPAAVDQVQPQTEELPPEVQPLMLAIKAITPGQGQQIPAAEQDQAIRTIAQYAEAFNAANEMIKADPENAMAKEAKAKIDQLVKPILTGENVFKGLTAIVTSDTSSLSAEEKQQSDQNKITSMWTLAALQKIFREEVNKELANENLPPMSLGEAPGLAQIVGNIKSDPNPKVREAGIVALMEVADPKNPKDVELINVVLNTAAEQDSSEGVKEVAKNAIVDLKTAAEA